MERSDPARSIPGPLTDGYFMAIDVLPVSDFDGSELATEIPASAVHIQIDAKFGRRLFLK